jgi:adenylate cyclase
MASDVAESTLRRPAPAAPTPRRRLAFAALVLLLLSAVCAPIFVDLVAHDAPRPARGVVSYSTWGPLTRPVELRGEWRFVWLGGKGVPAGAELMKPVPGRWDLPGPGRRLPESGLAGYRLRIEGLQPGRHTLYVPTFYGASRVIVNGRTLSQRGVLGTSPETTRTVVRANEVSFDADGSPVDVEIDLASFQHRDDGMEAPPVLGLAEGMARWGILSWLRSLLIVTSLLLLACYGVVVFLFRPRDRASLYFALGCISILPLMAMFSHDNLLLVAFPNASFLAMLAGVYLSSALALSFILAYTRELFPRETPRLLYWFVQALALLLFATHAVVALTGDTLRMSHISQLALLLRAACFLYMLGVVAAASVRGRDGALVFLLGLTTLISSLIYTDLVGNAVIRGFIEYDVLSIGMLLLLFSHIVILAERWSLAIGSAEATTADLRRLLDVNISITSEVQLEALLAKIVKAVSAVIHADRSSLFLHDSKTNELWAVVAEGVERREIRFPAENGVAGWSFTHGEPVNLVDAYEDARFNRAVDVATGYRTKSVLTVPVTARDGRRLGVMQALNRLDGPYFGEAETERMTAFAAQAAVAIDNATLFSEVASERNYNESILRSMSSGVVTLDEELRVAKVNAAAARILELPESQALGVDTRDWLAENNPLLLLEVEGVLQSGEPKNLLEAEVRTGSGSTLSANISIVPLRVEGEAAGLLVILDDITEGRRLQGAMRRFMTQKVVDQIMGREDDLLFGTACLASVMFADIRGFTSIAEQLQPRETVDMLNEVFTDLFEAVAAHDGVLDKFLGDALMAVYGAPLPAPNDALNAVKSAIEMIDMMAHLNRRGGKDLRLGIGIATGEVVAGTIGSPKRMDYTVIGDSVNLAARLQQVTKLYKVDIIVCETTAAAVKSRVRLRELDTIRVRGRQRPAKIFQVLPQAETESPAFEAYARGRQLLANRRWGLAVAAFEQAVHFDPEDRPAALMLERARILAQRPPSPDWDGVWDEAEAA